MSWEREAAVSTGLRPVTPVNQDFLAGIFHEFYTPLTVIKEFVSILQDGMGGAVTREQKEFLAIVYRNAFKIENLLQDIRTYCQLKFGVKLDVRVDLVDLSPLVEDVLAAHAATIRTKALDLQFTPRRVPVCVLGDRKLLFRAIHHLVANAVGFTPDSGTVRVRIDADHVQGCPEVRVVVEDSGIGIPEGDAERVFEPFYRSPNATQQVAGGLGLGLTVTRKIAEDHGGSLHVLGRNGTTAVLTLPLQLADRGGSASRARSGRAG